MRKSYSFPLLLLFAFLLYQGNVYSQRTLLQGKISAPTDIDVEGINIYNVTRNQGTISNSLGEFAISAALHDTISISAVQIESATIIIDEEQLSSKKLFISLNGKMNQLPTVTIRKPLTGYIGTDASLIKTEDPITASSLGLPNADLKKLTKTERSLYAANSGPVDALANLISGRTKMLKKRKEFEKTYSLTLALADKFPETFFINALGIPRFKVYSFLFYCEEDPEYTEVMKEDTMTIIEFLRKKSREYLIRLEQN